MDLTARILDNVRIDGAPDIGPFAVIGQPPRDGKAGETIIGEGARIRSHAVIYAGVTIGRDFFCGHHALIREGCRIGDGVSIGSGAVLERDVMVEDHARIHSMVYIPEYTHIGRGVFVGPRACFTNAKYPTYPGVRKNLRGADVRDGAIVGANATILPGIVIGERAVIGAGAVVTRDVEAGTVVAGNPARPVGRADGIGY
ncbi:transferase [bacterium]|nr:transferase [bacterium]